LIRKVKYPKVHTIVANDKAPTPIPKLGHVSSSCWSVEYNNPFSIAIMKDGKKQIGKQSICRFPLEDISIPVEVVSSHYVDPKGERVRS
jgi:glycine cleavage system aminomethyltransferase T